MALQEQQRKNDFLWMVLGLVILIAVGYFYTYPQILNWQSSLISAEAKRQDAAALQAKVSEVEAKRQEVSQNQDVVNQLDLIVPPSQAEDDFIATIEAIAQNSGLVINFFQPNPNSDDLEVSLNVNGSFLGIGLFLQDLNNNLRPVKISDLRITSVSAVEEISLLNATMNVTAATSIRNQSQGGTNGQ